MKKILLFISLFMALFANAQPPEKFYTKFGGAGIDIGYGVKQTLDRNYIVVGSTSSYGAGNTDVYLVKVDSMGWPRWEKTFGGFGNDVGRSVIQLADSSFVIAGFTNSFGAGGYDAYLIHADKAGSLIWQKTFGGLDWDFGYDLVQATDGNIVICGTTSSFGSGNMDGFMCKFDLSGTLIWQKFFGGAEDDELKSIIKTNDGKLATVGYTKSKGDLNGDCSFYKIDLNGDTLFTKSFGGPGVDYLTDLIQKPYNDYIVVGAKTFSTNAYTNSVYFNYSQSGTFNWDNNYNYSNTNENLIALTNSQTGDKTCYLRNIPVTSFKMQGSVFISKNSNISPYLSNAFGGVEDEMMFGLDKTLDGGYVSIGTTNSFNSINGDVFLIKQDSLIINYTSVVGLQKNKSNNTHHLIYAYDDNLFISMPVKNSNLIELYDLNGALLLKSKTTTDKTEINLALFPKGVYVLRIYTDDGDIFTKKIVSYKSN
ncbi:MAG: T9SS type A sorting domain-containing protein [Bacteroidetes bacterium]|nr:T9SS type A sorting domain-containing protein [Bacteroidota bacterium]